MEDDDLRYDEVVKARATELFTKYDVAIIDVLRNINLIKGDVKNSILTPVFFHRVDICVEKKLILSKLTDKLISDLKDIDYEILLTSQ